MLLRSSSQGCKIFIDILHRSRREYVRLLLHCAKTGRPGLAGKKSRRQVRAPRRLALVRKRASRVCALLVPAIDGERGGGRKWRRNALKSRVQRKEKVRSGCQSCRALSSQSACLFEAWTWSSA